ncbi:MAG: VWA domain-containing protein [Frankiales bacterium]|nr:VWA domain-containing protein [Frankiales bacterium]
MSTAAPYDVVDSLVGLAATLRGMGVAASTDRVHAAVSALAELDPTRRADVYWAGRLTLCGTPDELARYDLAFAAYFGDRPGAVVRRQRLNKRELRLVAEPGVGSYDEGEEQAGESLSAAASAVEQLRHRDVATMTPQDKEHLRRLLAALRLPGERRTTRRLRPSLRGRVDGRRTLRAWLAAGGEPAPLRRRSPASRPRRVVLLVDVSGSMESYAEALLRFAHAASRRGAPTEVFALGTRLTRLTREMALRDPDTAMAAVAQTLVDAGGGTRLGELLKQFLDQWGQRGTARGAVVVVLSDGWEQGDPTLLGEQVARLHRLAHRVVWSNPRKAAPGYQPLAGGMAAALPHVDDFVDGHSLAALEELAAVVRGASRRQVVRA